jgi:hypothetical protein
LDPRVVSENKVPGVKDLAVLHEYAVKMAEDSFAASASAPFRFLVRKGKRVVVIDTPWEDVQQKEMHSQIMRMYMQMIEADAYSFMSEVWIGIPKNPTTYDGTPPSEMPEEEREDALVVLSFDRTGAHFNTRFGVRRAGTPHAKLLARDDWQRGTETTSGVLEMTHAGRMWNMLEPEQPLPEDFVNAEAAERKRSAEQDELLEWARPTALAMPPEILLGHLIKAITTVWHERRTAALRAGIMRDHDELMSAIDRIRTSRS